MLEMTDRFLMAARLDFQSMSKRPAISYKKALFVLIGLVLFASAANTLMNFLPLNFQGAIDHISKLDYEISEGKISLEEDQRKAVNAELLKDGFYLKESAIDFGKTESISYGQLLDLTGSDTLSSRKVSELLKEHSRGIRQGLFFYFLLKELSLAIWMLVLVLVLSRTTQKYFRNKVQYSFVQSFDWVSSLALLPIISWLILNGAGFPWGTRIFFCTMIYTILVFAFARSAASNQQRDYSES